MSRAGVLDRQVALLGVSDLILCQEFIGLGSVKPDFSSSFTQTLDFRHLQIYKTGMLGFQYNKD